MLLHYIISSQTDQHDFAEASVRFSFQLEPYDPHINTMMRISRMRKAFSKVLRKMK